MRSIAVIGGGRWSRVIITVLSEISDRKIKIIWITRHGYEAAQKWVSENTGGHIEIFQNRTDVKQNLDGAIIATAVKNHFSDAMFLLKQDIPVLIEKPFALTLKDATKLIETIAENPQQRVAGVNHEFIYASFLHKFCKILNDVNITSLKINWHDPSQETRYGETKIADLSTPITDDMLPHVLSITGLIIPIESLTLQCVNKNSYNDVLVKMNNDLGLDLEFHLSRVESKRTRFISINQGEYQIDFSEEPGEIIIKGQSIENEWHGTRPLSRSLSSFTAVIETPYTAGQWPLHIKNFARDIEFLEAARTLLAKKHSNRI